MSRGKCCVHAAETSLLLTSPGLDFPLEKPPQPTHSPPPRPLAVYSCVRGQLRMRCGASGSCWRGARSCARLAGSRHLKDWIRDVFRAEMSNPASSTVYLLQSTTLLYARARARTHARRNMSETQVRRLARWCRSTVQRLPLAACDARARARVAPEQLLARLRLLSAADAHATRLRGLRLTDGGECAH